jgi:hypothetical protein
MKNRTRRTLMIVAVVIVCSVLATVDQYIFHDQSHTAYCAFFARWASIFCIVEVIYNRFSGKDDNDNG